MLHLTQSRVAKMRSEKFDSLILIGLLLLTIFIILLQRFAFQTSFIIDVNSPFPVNSLSDEPINNGKSKASLTKNADHFLLDCHIIPSNYPWPFCEMAVSFAFDENKNFTQALDLSSYKKIKVSAQYLGESSASIRFHLRSYNQSYSSYNDQKTWKYNGIEYWPQTNDYPVIFPLDALQVSTWWLIEQEIPIAHSAPEYDQVMVLEIATGNGIEPGHYQLKIEKIEFVGNIFSNTEVYIFIISMWVFTAIISLFVNLKRSKIKLAKSLNRTIELQQLNRLLNVESKALKNQVERDPLTGALNRSGIEAVFTNEIKVISLIFIDIDHFKPINDQFGHDIGDEVLVEFVKLISENCRSTDFLARWGGEEFLLICPNTALNEAYELAQCLRAMIEEHHWVKEIKLTSSFGVAQKTKEAIAQTINRADQALYAAKARGRNKVIISENDLSTKMDSSITF